MLILWCSPPSVNYIRDHCGQDAALDAVVEAKSQAICRFRLSMNRPTSCQWVCLSARVDDIAMPTMKYRGGDRVVMLVFRVVGALATISNTVKLIRVGRR